MHVLIIGATGHNGALIQAEALSRGHTITALVRDPSSLAPLPDVTLVAGTPLSLPTMRTAFRTPRVPDAVIVALDPRRLSDSPFAAPHPENPPALIHDAVRNALDVMKDIGVRKIVINSMQGIGASSGSMIMPLRVLFEHTNMKYTVDEHRAVDELINERQGRTLTGSWFARRCSPKERRCRSRISVIMAKGYPGCPRSHRKSVAAFMVDAAEKQAWNGQAPVITN